MAQIKSFRAIRPVEAKAAEIAALPYDVYNRQEAKAAVGGPPEILFKYRPPGDTVSGRVRYVRPRGL